MTLKEQIVKKFRIRYLQQGKTGFVNSQSIQDYAHEHFRRKDGSQFKHETIGRTLRILAEQGILKAELMDGKNVDSIAYQYIPSPKEILNNYMKNR